MAVKPVTVAETPLFERQAAKIWTAEEHDEFVDYIARHPEAGDIVPDTGGVRKVRWRRSGTGKRGGVRVIHFYYDQDWPLYLMMIFTKAERDDLSPEQKREMRKMAMEFKVMARVRGGRR
jgi:hypothetical protein